MKSDNHENDFISSPPKAPITLEKPHAVGDKVSYTMPWMGGRDVYVSATIVAIEGENALLKTTGFFESDETGIEPLAHLSPWTTEDEEHLKSFDDTSDDAPASFKGIQELTKDHK
jgi:hypothetical protein